MSEIRIGTSGWSYPTGKGTWNGIFYPVPPGKRSRRGGQFDDLRFYAEHFDTVEINSTFYGVPTPTTTRGWTERTPPGFEFSLKLFQKFTHPDMFLKATGGDPWTLGQKDVDDFRGAIEPLASAGKLGALLAQFPASFRNEPDARAYLEWLLERFKDYPVALELRHRSWSDKPEETLQMLDAFGAAWAQIDEPKFRFSIRQNLLPNVRTFYYLRLHGRNAAAWFDEEVPSAVRAPQPRARRRAGRRKERTFMAEFSSKEGLHLPSAEPSARHAEHEERPGPCAPYAW